MDLNISNIMWNWAEVCGLEGLVPWNPTKYDIGACFLQVFLQVPIISIFAVLSAFYCGIQSPTTNPSRIVKWSIRCRSLCSLAISIIPVIRTCILKLNPSIGSLRFVDYLTLGVELIGWCVHAAYVLSLRHKKNNNGPIIMRMLWIFTVIINIINLRSMILSRSDAVSLYCCITIIILQVMYGVTLFTISTNRVREEVQAPYSLMGSHYRSFREDLDPGYLGVAMENTLWLSRLIFYWVHPLIRKGVENKIEQCEDLHDLPISLNTSNLGVQLDTALVEGSTLLKALHRCFAWEFYAIGILKLIADILAFGGPLLLNLLVNFIENEPAGYWGHIYVLGLFLTTLSGAFLNVHFSFFMARIGLKFRGALISVIYRKTLMVSDTDINRFSVGEIVNFMSTDTERIVNSCPSFHSFWSIPLQIAICFYLLYRQVGISFLAGVAFAVVLIPINKFIASKIGSLSSKLMTQKDRRVSNMSEILRGIRILKLHVWEEHFLRQILNIRHTELSHLKSRKYLDALCVYFWATTPILVTTLTLGTYVLLGNELNAATIFTTLALLNMLIAPLNAFPWVLNGLMEAWVSLNRIQRLLNVPYKDLRDYYLNPQESEETTLIEFHNFTGAWSDTAIILSNLNLKVDKGQLVAILGGVGSGKSAVLSAILGEMIIKQGSVLVKNWDGGFGFVSQTPWLQHGTIRDNILFGKNYDSGRYKATLEACCLIDDLKSFKNEDMTKVGDAGTTLSGGQKVRIALARAIYQDKDLYLLDDILSALDPIVGRQVYQKAICGVLMNKTRILCTSNVQLLSNVDYVIEVRNGTIISSGKPSEVLPNIDDLPSYDTESMTSLKTPAESSTLNEKDLPKDEEIRKTGQVPRQVLKSYWSQMGGIFPFLILAFALMQGTRNGSDYWLSIWVAGANHTLTSQDYLIGYGIFAVANSIFTLLRAFLFAYGGVKAAKLIHEKLLQKLVFAQVTFFDIQPIGRILNRVSSDTYTIDDSLPFILNILGAQFFGLSGAVILIVNAQPWLLLVLAPFAPMYCYLLTAYRECSREIKRLSCLSLSPLYNHFNETLSGITTIRAFRHLLRFEQHNAEHVEYNQRVQFAGHSVTAWLSLRLQCIGVGLATGVALISVIQHEFDTIAPGLVGLTVAYALSITSLLSGLVTAFAESEREFVAMERVHEYINEIEQETENGEHPPYGWPSQGVVEFNNVYMTYRSHLPPSLNGISFKTRSAEKIGIVGRTGAGKSSLITTLLRLVDSASGHITIDSVNIKSILLNALRSRICVIPQDPYLFLGTFRENIDPLSEFGDNDIWRVLDKCHVKGLVENLGGLNGALDSAGKNLSQGQRQLLCIARAVLKNSKIVCIDEATASVDQQTDKLIQQTIHSCFRHSTLLIIAHRISTVMSCDRLLVLRDGEIMEFDTPDSLMNDSSTYFYRLAHSDFP